MDNIIEHIDEESRKERADIRSLKNDLMPLARSLVTGIKKSIPEIRFSKQYHELKASIASKFFQNLKDSGSLREIFNWEKLDMQGRQNLLKSVVEDNFMRAFSEATNSEESNIEIVYEKEFPEWFSSQYRTTLSGNQGSILFDTALLENPDPQKAFSTAIQESAKHIDSYIIHAKPKGFEHDAELLESFQAIRRKYSQASYAANLPITPDEQIDFLRVVRDPALGQIARRQKIHAIGREVGSAAVQLAIQAAIRLTFGG